MQIEVSRDISATAERVWEVITDLEGTAKVLTAIDDIEILSGPSPLDVGTTWRETRTMFGRSATEEMSVVAVRPGTSYSVVAEHGSTRYESEMSVVPHGSGSTLTMTFGATSNSAATRLMAATVGRLFAGATRKAIEQDLADIAAAVETPEVGGQSGGPQAEGTESGGRPVGP